MDRVQFPYVETPVSSYGNSGFPILKLEFLYSETGVPIAGNCASHITYRYVLVIISNFVCYNGTSLLNIIQSQIGLLITNLFLCQLSFVVACKSMYPCIIV